MMNKRSIFLAVFALSLCAAAQAADAGTPAVVLSSGVAKAAAVDPVSISTAASAPAAPAVDSKPASAAEKPLQACAANFQPVLDSYQQAHDSLLTWLKKASGKMDVVDARIANLKSRVTPFDASQKGGLQAAGSDRELQALRMQLVAEEARRKELCRALSAAVAQKVREQNASVLDALTRSTAASR